MILRVVCCVLLLAIGTLDASAQIPVRMRDAGRGPGPELLARALAAPHSVVPPAASQYLLRKDTSYSQTLIVLGRDVVVEGAVARDLIVVGGDVYMHPGGRVDGRVAALGGGVYESMLAHIGGGISAFRDFTYDISPEGSGFVLDYHALEYVEAAPAFELSGIKGLLIPSYDRTNGLSIPLGVTLRAPGTRLRLEPKATYRSQLGRVDPWIALVDSLGGSIALPIVGGRSTFSNDAWIRSDPVNSLQVIAVGNDTRNYFRATRGEATIGWRSDSGVTSIMQFIGVRGEHALSVRPGLDAVGGPWSFKGRHGSDDMLRPNPEIDNGTIASVITGTAIDWASDAIVARAGLDLELGRARFDSVASLARREDRDFLQATFDGTIAFPTFGLQTLRIDGHAVWTSPGATPRQRWVYLGGSGTLPPMELLELGGDQLFYVDSRYSIPIERVRLPMVGSPIVTLRDALGGAAVGEFPTIHQAIGLRLSASAAYVEFMIDPATRKTHFGLGISFTR